MSQASLEQLASVEAELRQIVTSIPGTIEEKTVHLRVNGVFRRYSEVFSSYLSLAEPPDSDVEALKRAMFLAWYEVTEPACFSGVSDLPEDARRRIVSLLESLVGDLDDESRWMLAYYVEVADYAFPGLQSHPRLKALLRSLDPESWRSHRDETDRMKVRGLMGEYWLSVFAAA